MLPTFATNDFAYTLSTYAESVGNGLMCRQSFHGTNQQDLLGGEFRLGSVLSTPKPVLLPSIGHIVEMRPEKQMLWVDAQRHIAPMTDKLTFRNRAICQFPGEAMGHDADSIWRRHQVESPISLGVEVFAGPQPAGVGFIDETPKPNDRPFVVLIHGDTSTPCGGEMQ